jgi:cell wall-associated NlpC family hydrolase
VSATEHAIAAELIERLLADPAFRNRFRRDPVAACREAGLDELAEEMRLGGGKAMHTLDLRESRSSLAGVMMAAAMEGMGVYEFSRHVVPHLEDLPRAVEDVLSRVNLPVIPGRGELAAAPPGSRFVPPPDDAPEPPPARAAAAAVAPAAPPAPADAGKGADAAGGGKAGDAAGGGKDADAAGGGKAAAKDDAAGGGKTADKEDAADKAAAKDEAGGKAPAKDAAPDSGRPDGPVPLRRAEGGPDAPAEPPRAAAAAAPEPPPEQPAASSGPVDPSQFGAEGTGGPPSPEALALLKNKNVVLDADGVSDLKEGRVDPRIVGVLTKLSGEHKITISVISKGHSKFTTGGSVSNHFVGRGLDIAAIDDQIVGPGSPLAREVASELSELDPSIRPTEIGSPFAISGPGFFTDAAHQNHIHVGFDGQIPADFKLPAGLAAGGAPDPAAAAAAAPAAAPAAGAVAAAPPAPQRDSGIFSAIAERGDARAASDKRAGDSGLFAAIDKPERRAAAAGAAPADAAPDLAGAPTDYPGDDAPRQEIAAWMAAEAKRRGIPPQLPVMAALVESNLKNLNFGDADSVGFFQMRLSIWNQGEYAGYPDDPEKQIDWFLDHAQEVKKQRLAAGESVTDPNQFGEWIANVEQPAEQFRGRYQLRLGEANRLLADAPKAAAAQAPAAAPAAPAVAPATPDPPAGGGAPPPEAPGGGGSIEAATKALLANNNVDLPPGARSDLQGGVVDPRLVAVMTDLAKDHKIGLSVIKTGHSQFTTSGSVSNHFSGRAIDIATVDGSPVSPGNAAARDLVSEIAQLKGAIKPTEVGSPWPIGAPGFFTDGAHQNHVHVAFDDAAPADFKLPAAEPDASAPPAVAVAAAAPVAPVAPAPKGDSGIFAAIQDRGEVKAASVGRSGDSGLFAAIDEPRAVAAAPAGGAAAAVPADAAAAAGAAAGVPVGAAAPADAAAAAPGGAAAAGYPAGSAGAAADAAAPPALARGAAPKALAALTEAKKYMGTPYKWGGSTPQTGFDCSGLVQWAYAKAGVQIPRVTDQQFIAGNGAPVRKAELRPGDLVFFREPGGYIHHVGMSLGGSKFIHAPHTGDVVKTSSLDEPYYKAQFAGGRRFAQGPAVAAPAPAPEAAAPGAAAPAAAAAAVNPADVAAAQAAVARDAAEAAQPDSGLFKAISVQEARNHEAAARAAAAGGKRHDSAIFLQAITPEDADAARRASAAAASGPPAPGGGAVDLSDVPADYPGDDASKEELAKWLASEAQKAGLPPELPVMAALVESGVKNLNFGDADSVGFFQMRVSIWNQGEYAGYPDNPGLQIKWFIDHALEVKKQRLAAGESVTDPNQFGEWIADVERPAEQFRGRYQLRLREARGLVR